MPSPAGSAKRRKHCRKAALRYKTTDRCRARIAERRSTPEGLAKWRRQVRARGNFLRELIWWFKSQGECVDCGEKDPRLLDYDHRDQETKVLQISAMVARGRSIKQVMAEIAKCDLRCVKCHRLRTIKQMGWFKFLGELG